MLTAHCKVAIRPRITAGGGGGGGGGDPLQPFKDGGYTETRIYAGRFPKVGAPDILLGQSNITGHVVNSSTDITLVYDNPNPLILATSASAVHKYGVHIGAGKPNKYFSVGESGDPWSPNFVVGDMQVHQGDHWDWDGTMHVVAEEDPVDHYNMDPETFTPESTFEYDVIIRAVDASNNPVYRIGRTLTVSMLGSGGAVVDPVEVVTDREGIAETVVVTAGDSDVVENVHVEDLEEKEGTGPNVTPVEPNSSIVNEKIAAYLDLTGGGLQTLEGVVIGAGKWMLVRTQGSTAKPVTPTADGITFPVETPGPQFVEYNAPVGTVNIRYYLVSCPSGFSGDIDFNSTAGGPKSACVMELTLSAPATVSFVLDNIGTLENWTGSATPTQTIPYPEEFANHHNAAVACMLEFGEIASAPTDVDWAELSDLLNNPIAMSDHASAVPVERARWLYAGTPGFVAGMAVELQAIP